MTRRRVARIAIGAVGIPLAIVAAWVVIQVIASAWGACGDNEPPYLFGLVFVQFPLLAAILAVGWIAIHVLLRRRDVVLAVVSAAAFVSVVGWWWVSNAVPMNEPGYYAALRAEIPLPRCGPDGIPGWWPGWLPF